MALDGGGGGGPVGIANAFTGAAEALEIYGDFAAAYSGNVGSGSSGSEADYFLFTTGNYLFKGLVQFCHPTDATENMTYKIYFNGAVVQQWINTGNLEPNQPQNPVFIIIPAYTQVQITCSSSGSARGQVGSITGRIYR